MSAQVPESSGHPDSQGEESAPRRPSGPDNLEQLDIPGNAGGWFDTLNEVPSGRVPHAGHAMLFLTFTLLLLLLAQLFVLTLGQPGDATRALARTVNPKRQLVAQGAVYIAALAGCFLTFPLLWGRGFLAGLNWNGTRARRHLVQLVPLGLAVGLAVQAISSLIPTPKSIPMDDFFRTSSDIWLVAAFGTLLAPLFEEIAFRGFLLPALCIAFDWLGATVALVGSFAAATLAGVETPRHVAAFAEDRSAGIEADTGNLFFRSAPAVLAASLASSALFAWLHADQIGRSLGGLSVLFCVSLILTLVRVKSKSVACSTVVHMSYNLSVFITLFVATGGFRHLDRMAK